MTNWRDDALCRQVDTDLFFPEKGHDTTRAACRVCISCTARAQCLEEALADDTLKGVWGGTSPNERAKIRRARGITSVRAAAAQEETAARLRLVEVMSRQSAPLAEIALELGLTERSVSRYLAKVRAAA